MVATCVVMMPALTLLAARSYRVEEQVVCGRDTGTFNERAASASAESAHIKVESGLGVVGLSWERRSWSDDRLLPFDFDAVRVHQGKLGWSLRRQTTSGAIRPVGRSRQDVGPRQTLRWEHRSGASEVLKAGGLGSADRWGIVVPYWLLILPGAGPLVWWLWCPPGRAFPRLTMGRLGITTAGPTLILAGLTAFERSSASDRALAVIAEFGGSWVYGPDPAGSGRSVVTQVEFAKTLGSRFITDAEVPRIRAALAEFPQLQSLQLDVRGAKLTRAGLASITDSLNLPIVGLAALPVDDAMMVHLGNHKRLRSLDIAWTKVTDAGLVHLGSLPALESLSLKGLAISDAGIMRLAHLPQLRTLNLSGAGPRGGISKATMRQLFGSIPTLELIVITNNQWMSVEQLVTRRNLMSP